MKRESLSVHLIAKPIAVRSLLFTAIRTAYSPETPFDLWVGDSFDEYESKKASDGLGGTEVDRLFRHIVKLGHTSTLEHINFTFTVSGVSRALLAQLTRHRVGVSPTVQSQRYVDDKSEGKKSGFKTIVPPTIEANPQALSVFESVERLLQMAYDELRKLGIPKEDARFVLMNGASTNLTLTMNLRAALHLYKIRAGKGAQWEIKEFAEAIKQRVVEVEPWLEGFFVAK